MEKKDLCCEVEEEFEVKFPMEEVCPRCGKLGKRVDSITVKSLYRGSLEDLPVASFRFCETENCPVVYYTEGFILTEENIKERVYQKHRRDPDVYICYCFQHKVGDILGDLQNNGISDIPDRIKEGVKLGKCACEIKNPQGRCCLGNVLELIKVAKS
jgi:hypothetical protein